MLFSDPKRLRWGNKSITYRIRNYPIQILQFPYPDKPLYAVPLPDHKVDKLIREAFNVWSNVTDLIFIEIKERVRGLELVSIRNSKSKTRLEGKGSTIEKDGNFLVLPRNFPVFFKIIKSMKGHRTSEGDKRN